MQKSDLVLDLGSLRSLYLKAGLSAPDLAELVNDRAQAAPAGVWITLSSRADLVAQAERVEQRRRAGAALPLYGVPCAVKDNIDVADMPTSAACAEATYVPTESAYVVRKLVEAGALVVGKTNLDQFATGLVGVRSPFGVPRNPFDPRYIVGGSSSGSAVAVSTGLVSFALGTDTAGSGRVPAAFNNIVGLKPTRGLFSTRGVVPACASLDCVSLLTLNAADARFVADVIVGHDPSDPYSRNDADRIRWAADEGVGDFRFGVLGESDLIGDEATRTLYREAVRRLEAIGGIARDFDFAAFRSAAKLLYDGPFVAERLLAVRQYLPKGLDALLPVTRQIVDAGARYTAIETFEALHELIELHRIVNRLWLEFRLIVVPTAPTIYTVDEIEADPISKNAALGTYTNFANLLDLAAIALPAGFRDDGLPFGISLIGPALSDPLLGAIAERLERTFPNVLGATGKRVASRAAVSDRVARHPSKQLDRPGATSGADAADTLPLCVVGAHLSGLPLNHQLTDLGARLKKACCTAPHYRLYALPATEPPKPGLVRDESTGHTIEVEVWDLPRAALGSFFRGVVSPLCIGYVELETGERVPGFLCEGYAVVGAREISEYGGWRAFLKHAAL